MSGIVLSAAVRQNLLALQQTAANLATTQNDLSTGKKVNSALDNPTNFFTAQGLDNRASDISNLLDGISNGVQVLQAANTGITSLESLVSQAKSIADQALQTSIGYSTKSSVTSNGVNGATATNLLGTTTGGSFTGAAAADVSGTTSGATLLTSTASTDSLSTSISAGNNLTVNGQTITFASSGSTTISATGSTINATTGTVQNVIDAINAITGSTTASISSGKISIATGTGTGVTISGNTSTLGSLGLSTGGTSSNLATAVTGLSATATTLTGATPIISGQTLTIGATGNGTATTLTFGTGNGQVSTLDQLNTALAANNLAATINSSTGALTISTTNDAASATVGALGGSAYSTAGAAFHGVSAAAAPVADSTSQTTRATLVSQYNAILTQIDNTSADSSYNGVNLLAGDQLQLTFNETGKSKLSITGVQFNSAGLGLSSLTATNFADNNATNTVLTGLSAASSTLRSEASALGSNLSVVQTRQDFNTNLINVLQTGSANLTQADINLEAANSQALSTRQSLSVSALSLANQSQQSVLQLLR